MRKQSGTNTPAPAVEPAADPFEETPLNAVEEIGDPSENTVETGEAFTTTSFDPDPADEPQPVKRGRGRPPGSRNKTAGTPADKPTKPTRKKTEIPVSLDNTFVAQCVVNIHAMLAKATSVPEFVIDDDEAKTLVEAATSLAAQYAVVLDPRTMAWANFGMAVIGVYGTRVLAYQNRVSREKKSARIIDIKPTETQTA